MKIQILNVRLATYQPGRGWQDGMVRASVDGYRLSYRRGGGWFCQCDPEGRCEHAGAVAELIHPDAIAGIDARRRQHEARPAKLPKAKAAAL